MSPPPEPERAFATHQGGIETAIESSAITLAQIAAGPLAGTDDTIRLIIMAVLAVVAGAAAWQAAQSESFGPATGLWIAGLVVAGLIGFLFYDVPMALFAASIFAIAASAVNVFVLGRDTWEIGFWSGLAAIGLVGVMALADVKTGAFMAGAVLSVYGALKVLQSTRLVHGAVWLALALGGVAGIFLSLGAEFLAIIQILVYVGAVVTLFLFTVMLTTPEDDAHFLDDLELPPGVTVESVTDLNPGTPRFGQGPYKGLTETNPRKPVREPETLYGVSITDGVYGDETTLRRTWEKERKKNENDEEGE